MPQYFFHAEGGQPIHDDDGTELADLEAARAEFVHRACKLLTADPKVLWKSSRWRMVTTDAAGLILFSLEIRPEAGVNVMPWRATG